MKISIIILYIRNMINGWKFMKGIFGFCIRENVLIFGVVIRGWVVLKSVVFFIFENV